LDSATNGCENSKMRKKSKRGAEESVGRGAGIRRDQGVNEADEKIERYSI